MNCRLAFFLLGTFFPIFTFSQEPVNIRYTTETGFPSQELYDVTTDSAGYLWVASSEGLIRFDGLRSVIMKLPPNLRRSLSGLKIAGNNSVWAFNFDFRILYTQGDSLTLVSGIQDSKQNFLPRFTILPDGRVVIAQSFGLLVFDPETGKSEKISSPGGKETYCMDMTFSHRDQRVYLYDTEHGLLSWKPGEPRLMVMPGNETYRHPTGALFLVDHPDGIVCLAQVTHQVLLYTGSGFRRLPVSDYFQKNKIWATLGKVLPKNGFWISTYTGMYKLDRLTDKEPSAGWFKDIQFSNLCEDRNGALWFSSLQDGLFQIPDPGVVIYTENNSSLSDNSVTCFEPGPWPYLFTGLYNGMVLGFNRETGVFGDFGFNNRKNVETLFYDPETADLMISSGGLWVVPEIKNGRNRYLVANVSVKQINKDPDGTIWVASSGGISSLKRACSKFKIGTPVGVSIPSPSRHVIVLGKDSVLFATRKNLYFYRTGDNLKEVTGPDGQPLIITSWTLDSWGRLILAADRKGLQRWFNGHLSEVFPVQVNQISPTVKALSAGKGRVWLGTNQGLFSLPEDWDSASELSGPYFREDVSALFQDEDFLYAGTGQGVIRVPGDWNFGLKQPPGVAISSVSVNGKDTVLSESYEFDTPPSVITVFLSAISFATPTQYRFRYRISGLSEDWNETPATSPFVRLIGLKPGDYVLEAETVFSGGVKSKKPALLRLVIHPPFWQTGWFLFLLAAGILMTILSVHRYQVHRYQARIRQEQEKEQMKQEILLSQMTALTAQMNPHFIFNALSSIQSFIFKNDKLNANVYLGKFSDLIRSILRQSESGEITLAEEIKGLKLYLELESLRFNGQLTWEINTLELPDPELVRIPPMILQPYVENAIKHGLSHKPGNRKLWILFSADPAKKLLMIEIGDNGIGRKRSAEINAVRQGYHQSFAHSATEKRLQLLEKASLIKIGVQITDSVDGNGLPAGTLVLLTLPLVTDD